MDELCKAMEKLTLSESLPTSPKKKRSAIRCWKCSELGHMKRFCSLNKSNKWVNRKIKRSKTLSYGSAVLGAEKESKKIRTMRRRPTTFKLKPSKLGNKSTIDSDEKRSLKKKEQNKLKQKKFINLVNE